MSALEQEIINKFYLLEPAAQRRVLDTLSLNLDAAFNDDAWWAQVDALQSSIRARLGSGEMVGALSLLDDLRDA